MAVQAQGVNVRLGGRTIIRDVALSAREGAISIIVGPNGSGKTTLMRALTGEIASSGAIGLNGRPLGDYRQSELAALRAVLPQETTLSFPFTVREIVRLGIVAGAARPPHGGERDRVEEALERVDLAGFAGRFYQELSGGERQRVQLARVLCQIWEPRLDGAPRWLFLDEPVSSLDIRHQLTIMEIARRYAAGGGGVVAIMHDLNLSAMYADALIVMSHGQIAAAGPPASVLSDGLLADVFGCPLRIGEIPQDRLFILPHSARI